MPRYYFKCACGETVGVLRQPEKRNVPQKCKCGRQMERDARGPSSRIVETLDNGIMSRRVERLADAERLIKERSLLPEDREP